MQDFAAEKRRVVVRRLPPQLPEAIFKQTIGQWIQNVQDFLYVAGKPSTNRLKKDSHSRAYLLFDSSEALLRFSQAFDGWKFSNQQGVVHTALVEYAPSQIVAGTPKEKDSLSGTVWTERHYLDFIAELRDPNSGKTVILDEPALIENPKNTPLLEHLRSLETTRTANAVSYARQDNEAPAKKKNKGKKKKEKESPQQASSAAQHRQDKSQPKKQQHNVQNSDPKSFPTGPSSYPQPSAVTMKNVPFFITPQAPIDSAYAQFQKQFAQTSGPNDAPNFAKTGFQQSTQSATPFTSQQALKSNSQQPKKPVQKILMRREQTSVAPQSVVSEPVSSTTTSQPSAAGTSDKQPSRKKKKPSGGSNSTSGSTTPQTMSRSASQEMNTFLGGLEATVPQTQAGLGGNNLNGGGTRGGRGGYRGGSRGTGEGGYRGRGGNRGRGGARENPA